MSDPGHDSQTPDTGCIEWPEGEPAVEIANAIVSVEGDSEHGEPDTKIVFGGWPAVFAVAFVSMAWVAIYTLFFAACFAVVALPLYVIGYCFDAALWATTGRSAPFVIDVAGGMASLVVLALVCFWASLAVERWRYYR